MKKHHFIFLISILFIWACKKSEAPTVNGSITTLSTNTTTSTNTVATTYTVPSNILGTYSGTYTSSFQGTTTINSGNFVVTMGSTSDVIIANGSPFKYNGNGYSHPGYLVSLSFSNDTVHYFEIVSQMYSIGFKGVKQ